MDIQTQIVKIAPHMIELEKIKVIAEILQREGIIAYPTDTFYGLGANCFSENAIQRIYKLKGRKPSKPLSIVVSDIEMMQEIVFNIPHVFWQIADEFWPGPLTIILQASAKFSEYLLGAGASIGIRLPDMSWLRKLVRENGIPITATSANISGERGFTRIEEVKETFYGKVDLIVDGGETRGKLPSTVIDLTSEKLKILRVGAVSRNQLKKFL
ncbi:MAG: threonylcarbamoyl-AMP synthase [Candidatus Aminicenantes bacterium]|nr:MAG: threonylcarbamoyl-AMP synthase [Candidatus Aminicenantes bacterium]